MIPNSTADSMCTRPAPRRRRGTGTFDLLVSFTLLATVMSVATPLVVRHGQILKSHRNYRLALDELSNQMDHLTALSVDDLREAVKGLTPSKFVAARLPGAQLTGELDAAQFGTRITLKLSWDETERRSAPVSLAAWVFTPESQAAKDSPETPTP
jgi:hypothetical protein